ncbi:helix-turn-helix domain-containing protein [Rhodococcoides yunnanense]|jgi:DNA-binding transcriptional ArsR family regulator|uniref:helix-turn-helix domain-containing protein n=1 Tax=Rhodococcoides yunnanense TaxID=278209 RepID=UPI0022B11B96|nr:helix-turn-helix domain-containing protein [Rhodococcus yunnanensis]MCZ4276252.1 hypothetical protein [Rhodococcus yunnanensis]
MTTLVDRFVWERVLRAAEMPNRARFVALVLATFCTPPESGSVAYPGIAKLATAAELSERSVRLNLDWLRDAGWVTRTKQVRRPRQGSLDEYRLSLPDGIRPLVLLETARPEASK